MTENRKDCHMRHENGNCTVSGGFCTAVNEPICEALHNAFDCGYRSALRSKQERNDWICTLKCTSLMEEGMCSHGGLCCLHESQRTIKENDPLTLDELRKMANQPVWIEDVGEDKWHGSGWAIVDREYCLVRKASNGNPAFFERYWKEWLAYRQKPEEGTV